MMNNVSSIPPTHVTTEQIQQCLDENKQLIMLIMENQNVGKFAECAPYQAQLQKNLMSLAKIADAQPPGGGGAATSYPMSPQAAMQQGGQFMQQSHSQAPHISHSQQQQSPYASKLPFHLTDQQLQQMQQSPHFQQQQFIQGQMAMRPGSGPGPSPSPNNSMYHTGYARNLMDMRGGGGGKQDGSDAGDD